MNKNDLIKKLENLNLPEIKLPSHQRRLKMALLNPGRFKKQTTLFLLKKFTPAGAVAVVAVIALLMTVSANKSAAAYAKEIAQKSYQAVSVLTPEQKEALKKEVHMVGDPLRVLQEAKNAKDLKVPTYDQLVSQKPNAILPELLQPSIDLHDVKFLQFTNTDGVRITLGIDQNNLPAFVSASYTNGQPSVGQPSVEGEQGHNIKLDDDQKPRLDNGETIPQEDQEGKLIPIPQRKVIIPYGADSGVIPQE